MTLKNGIQNNEEIVRTFETVQRKQTNTVTLLFLVPKKERVHTGRKCFPQYECCSEFSVFSHVL